MTSTSRRAFVELRAHRDLPVAMYKRACRQLTYEQLGVEQQAVVEAFAAPALQHAASGVCRGSAAWQLNLKTGPLRPSR